MAKKHKKLFKKAGIENIVITKEQRFKAEKPRFNAHQGGYGAFKNKKVYNRKDKHKQKLY